MDWQPIETAPRDGTEFFGLDPIINHDGTPYMQKCWMSKYGDWYMVDEQCGGTNVANPVLWMPLPELPK